MLYLRKSSEDRKLLKWRIKNNEKRMVKRSAANGDMAKYYNWDIGDADSCSFSIFQ